MKKTNKYFLYKKIIYTITIVVIILSSVGLLTFQKLSSKILIDLEIEKAELLTKTIEPIVGLNIYFDFNEEVSSLAQSLMKNPDVLLFEVAKDNKIITSESSGNYKESGEDAFIIYKDVYEPNSNKKSARIKLAYSSKRFKKLQQQYYIYSSIFASMMIITFFLLGVYVKKLLFPLHQIGVLLEDYSPDSKTHIPYSGIKNEIGLISNALNNMQAKIFEYASEQKNINAILERKVDEKTAELKKQLYTDNLTKVPNRLSLINYLQLVKEGALIIINIDDFKEINDLFGNKNGDAVLKDFAKYIRDHINTKEKEVYRLSGDEFAILIHQKISYDHLVSYIKEILEIIDKVHFKYDYNEITIRATLGATLDMTEPIEKSDMALKRAKKMKQNFLVYDENLNIKKQFHENMKWIKKLRDAIREDRIKPYFQPLFNAHTKEIKGYESLVRMIDTNGQVISPYFFLDIAKKTKQYPHITKIVIDKTCDYFADKEYAFSVNLSFQDITDSAMVDYIKRKVQNYNVANRITFEMLESEGIENFQKVSHFIDEMKSIGCKIAIDDFGSGYSNFEYLFKLKMDYLKIDGSLIKNLDTDKNSNLVVKIIVEFAKKTNVKTVAEFVHSEAILRRIQILGVDYAQGFHLGEPNNTAKIKISAPK